MKNYLTVVIAAALIVSTGIVHAFWTGGFDFLLGKPSPSEQLKVFADNMKNVPSDIGQWHGTDLTKMDAREKEIANVDASLEREYRNEATGAKSSVFLVSGHFRDVAVHTPDQCYVAAGYEMMSDTTKYNIETQAGNVECYTTVFKKEDTHVGTHYLRVFWTWSVDGNWVAPDSPRIEFVGQPALYKMYIISQLEQPSRSMSEDPSIGFVGQFIPQLNNALFPGQSEPGTGGDTQDALEPATPAPAATSPAVPTPIAIPTAGEPPVATPPVDAAAEGAKPGV
jgi:Protein of unknown function (DUF3485)